MSRAPRRTRGAVTVPAADGYHYGDDHPWGAAEQTSLIKMLKRVRDKFDQDAAKEQPAAE